MTHLEFLTCITLSVIAAGTGLIFLGDYFIRAEKRRGR